MLLMKPVDYLTNEEKFIYQTIKSDLKFCQNKRDLKLIENKLDVLLARAIKRYKKINMSS